MIRSFVSLAFLAGWATAHPQCFINDSPPDTDKTTNIFCPNVQYDGETFLQAGACCNDAEEEAIEAVFLSVSAGLTSTCADLYKQVLCGQCHSYSAHLFESLGMEFGAYDGMTMKRDFCDAFVDACADELTLGGPAEYDGQSYCDHHVGGIDGEDELWSYPYTDPFPTDGGLALLFPNINAASDFPIWQLSMRQTPDADMWWIVGQQGQISGVKTSDMDTAFDIMDIENQPDFLQSWPEEGLFDVAFDPGWSSNNFFYVSYTIDSGTVDGEGTSLAQNRISRFTYTEGDPITTRNSERVLLDTGIKLSTIHSAGWVGFKPSAYDTPISGWNDLYWGVGDGGPAGDTSNSGQDFTNLLGNMIRISVPSSTTETTTYEIPSGNYQDVDSSAAPEVCAPGLRNPWRCSFDKLTEDLWCADVGQGDYEEIDIVECGKNYGWPRFEGSSCHQLAIDEGLYPSCDDSVRSQYEFPIYEYCHSGTVADLDLTNGVDICGDREIEGQAIIGGFVYRGTYFAELLYGAYVFADHQTRLVNFIKQNEDGVWVSGSIISKKADIFISFSEDIYGELYLIDRQREIFYLPCGDMCSTTCLAQNDAQPSIESQGCYTDTSGDRALTLQTAPSCSTGETYMSPLICASYCSTISGAVYAGVSAGTDCYCGSSSDNYANNGGLGEESCATLCDSNPEETCGGVDAIEVFEIGPPITPPPTPAPIPDGGPTPPPVATGDDTCVNGLPGIDGSNDAGNVCCPLDCSVCGGDGCGSGGRSQECCINGVLNNQDDCSESGAAPCIVGDDIVTPAPVTPAPVEGDTCVNGIPGIDGSNDVGNVCCPLDCSVCGGDGCGSGGRSQECCINGVLNNQQDCSESGAAPCIVGDVVTPAPVTPTPAPVEGDTCANGLAGIDGSNDVGSVCCPLDCAACGGAGCGSGGRNQECCINGILNNQLDCSESGAAPCIVGDVTVTPAPVTPSPVVDPTPAPVEGDTCANGLPGIDGSNDVGNVCCPLDCSVCGGDGCGSGGRNQECCINGVLNNQQDCSVSGAAPCIVTDGPSVTPAPVTDSTPTAGYLGCFQDGRTPPPSPTNDEFRMFQFQAPISRTEMDAEFCKGLCDAETTVYEYYGTQFGRECWCGTGDAADTYLRYGPALGDTACNVECTGDATEMCGGSLIMSVYGA